VRSLIAGGQVNLQSPPRSVSAARGPSEPPPVRRTRGLDDNAAPAAPPLTPARGVAVPSARGSSCGGQPVRSTSVPPAAARCPQLGRRMSARGGRYAARVCARPGGASRLAGGSATSPRCAGGTGVHELDARHSWRVAAARARRARAAIGRSIDRSAALVSNATAPPPPRRARSPGPPCAAPTAQVHTIMRRRSTADARCALRCGLAAAPSLVLPPPRDRPRSSWRLASLPVRAYALARGPLRSHRPPFRRTDSLTAAGSSAASSLVQYLGSWRPAARRALRRLRQRCCAVQGHAFAELHVRCASQQSARAATRVRRTRHSGRSALRRQAFGNSACDACRLLCELCVCQTDRLCRHGVGLRRPPRRHPSPSR
jgi:hypothetical protein